MGSQLKPTTQGGWGSLAKLVDPKLLTAIVTSAGLDFAKDAITDKDVAKMMDDPQMRDMIPQILQQTQAAMNESKKTSSNVSTVTYGLLELRLVVTAIIIVVSCLCIDNKLNLHVPMPTYTYTRGPPSSTTKNTVKPTHKY